MRAACSSKIGPEVFKSGFKCACCRLQETRERWKGRPAFKININISVKVGSQGAAGSGRLAACRAENRE